MKPPQTLTTIILIFLLISAALVFHYEKTKVSPADHPQNQTAETQTPVPELVKQLYSAEIPRDLDPEKEKVSLQNGKVEIRGPQILEDGTPSKEFPDVFQWSAQLVKGPNSYAIADVNGDGSDDVAIVIGTTGGGSGYFYYLALFLSENGQLKFKTSQFLGDRIQINKISYKDGIFSADVITQGPNEPYCCGTLRKVFEYKLVDGKFEEIKK